MPLSWNEIKSRALTFSRTWADAAFEEISLEGHWRASAANISLAWQ